MRHGKCRGFFALSGPVSPNQQTSSSRKEGIKASFIHSFKKAYVGNSYVRNSQPQSSSELTRSTLALWWAGGVVDMHNCTAPSCGLAHRPIPLSVAGGCGLWFTTQHAQQAAPLSPSPASAAGPPAAHRARRKPAGGGLHPSATSRRRLAPPFSARLGCRAGALPTRWLRQSSRCRPARRAGCFPSTRASRSRAGS